MILGVLYYLGLAWNYSHNVINFNIPPMASHALQCITVTCRVAAIREFAISNSVGEHDAGCTFADQQSDILRHVSRQSRPELNGRKGHSFAVYDAVRSRWSKQRSLSYCHVGHFIDSIITNLGVTLWMELHGNIRYSLGLVFCDCIGKVVTITFERQQ